MVWAQRPVVQNGPQPDRAHANEQPARNEEGQDQRLGVYFERMQGATRKIRNGEVTLGAYDTLRFEGKVLRANLLDYPFNQR